MTSTDMRPWLPRSLRRHELTRSSVTRLSYIVVDEIVDGVATLAVYPWPEADSQGRVRFRDLDACRHVAVSLTALNTELYRKLTRREARVGDVFGAELTDVALQWLDGRQEAMWTRALNSILRGAVYDLSADARLVAKLAYYAAMTPVLAKEHMDHWNLAEKVEHSAEKAEMVDFDKEQKVRRDA